MSRIALVIIYLTYLCMASYAWGGVIGRSYGFGPTTIQTSPSGTSELKRPESFTSSSRKASVSTLYGLVIERGSPRWPITVTPCAAAPTTLSGGYPSTRIGRADGAATLHFPDTTKLLWISSENSRASSSQGWKNIDTVLFAISPNRPTNFLKLKVAALADWARRNSPSSSSASAWRSRASAISICKLAVLSRASAVALSAMDMRSLASDWTRFARCVIKIPRITSVKTPMVTMMPPVTGSFGNRPSFQASFSSGRDSIRRPRTTKTPANIITDSIQSKPDDCLFLSLLIGPLMHRRGGSIRGTIYAILAALVVGSLGWFLSR
jgi:hypothetical protein